MNDLPIDRFLNLPNLRVHLVDWCGPVGAPTILLIHGAASNTRMWNLVAPKLAQHFRVVAFDQRSHGLTQAPVDQDFSFAATCSDTHFVCKQLHIDRPILVGHSWGGNIALEYAVHYADSVAGIALLDGGYLSLSEVLTWSQVETMTAPPRWAGKPLAEFLEHAKQSWGGPLSAAALEEIMSNITVLADQTIAPHLSFDNHLKIMHATWEQSTGKLYAELKRPVHFMPCLPPEPRDLATQRFLEWKRKTASHIQSVQPLAKIDWLADSLHDVPLQHPALVAERILTFAKSVAYTVGAGFAR